MKLYATIFLLLIVLGGFCVALDVLTYRAVDHERPKNVFLAGQIFQATEIKEKEGCISGFRVDVEMDFKWCGEYMIVSKR